MKANKRVRRPKDKTRPLMPVKPRKPRSAVSKLSARARQILERTALYRFELERFLAGVDLSDLDQLAVVEYGPAKPRVIEAYDDKTPTSRPADRDLADIYLPKRTKICPRCPAIDHPGMGCTELRDWLRTARAARASWARATST